MRWTPPGYRDRDPAAILCAECNCYHVCINIASALWKRLGTGID
nr:MAG TPA: hypothetical protein [Caudoviricetes sp.]